MYVRPCVSLEEALTNRSPSRYQSGTSSGGTMPAKITSGEASPSSPASCSSCGRYGPSPTSSSVTGQWPREARSLSSSWRFFSSASRPTLTSTVPSAGMPRLARSTARRMGSPPCRKCRRSMPVGATNTGQRTLYSCSSRRTLPVGAIMQSACRPTQRERAATTHRPHRTLGEK